MSSSLCIRSSTSDTFVPERKVALMLTIPSSMLGISTVSIKRARTKESTRRTTARSTQVFFFFRSFRSNTSYPFLMPSSTLLIFSSFFSFGLNRLKNRGTSVMAEIRDASMAKMIV